MIYFKTRYGRYLTAKNRLEQIKKLVFANLLDYLKDRRKYELAWKIEAFYFNHLTSEVKK